MGFSPPKKFPVRLHISRGGKGGVYRGLQCRMPNDKQFVAEKFCAATAFEPGGPNHVLLVCTKWGFFDTWTPTMYQKTPHFLPKKLRANKSYHKKSISYPTTPQSYKKKPHPKLLPKKKTPILTEKTPDQNSSQKKTHFLPKSPPNITNKTPCLAKNSPHTLPKKLLHHPTLWMTLPHPTPIHN